MLKDSHGTIVNCGTFYWKVYPQLEMQSSMSSPFLGTVYVLTYGFAISAATEFSSIVKSNWKLFMILFQKMK